MAKHTDGGGGHLPLARKWSAHNFRSTGAAPAVLSSLPGTIPGFTAAISVLQLPHRLRHIRNRMEFESVADSRIAPC